MSLIGVVSRIHPNPHQTLTLTVLRSPSILAFMTSPLILALNVQMNKYMAVAGIAVYVYDSLLTSSSEVDLMWTSWSGKTAKTIYFYTN